MKDISYPLQSRYYTKAHTQTCVDKRNKATNMIRNAFFFFVISLHCRYNYIAVCIWTKMLKLQRHAHIYIPIKCLRHTPERPPHTIHTTWVHFGECPVRSSILGSFAHTHTHSTRSQWDKGTRERVRERVRNNEKFTLNGAIVCFFAYDSMSAHGYLSSPPQTYICLSIYNKMVFMKSSFYPHRFCLWPLCRYCSRCLHSSTAFESFCSGYLIPSEEHLCVHWMSEQHGCYLFVK